MNLPARSLTPRLIATILVPIVCCFVIFGFVTVALRKRAAMIEVDHEVRDQGLTLQVALDEFLRDHRIAEMSALTDALARGDRVAGVLVFDRFDHLASRSGSANAPESLMLPLAHRARLSKQSRGEVLRLPEGHSVYAYAFPIGTIFGLAEPRGGAVLIRDLDYVVVNNRRFARELAVGCVALMLSVALAAYLGLRRSVLDPLSGLMRGVERVRSGDLQSTVPGGRDDEMGRIADAFNRMLGSLREAGQEISSQHAANVALERRLQHAQRLALIGQMSASVAHEIGSPLNVVVGRARYALKQGGQSERDRRHFEEIVAGGDAISRVVERLLSQARRVRGTAARIDITSIARDTLRFLESECERAGIVTRLRGGDGYFVNAVRSEAEQVLLNLCINAVQAQPAGGELCVAVRRVVVDSGEPQVEIDVSDAGPGISPDLRERVFEAFFTTKTAPEGTGLGLAICDEIVRRQGGTIVATDAPEGGALFRVRLPEA